MVIVDTIAQNTRCYHYYLVMIPHHGATSHHAFLGLEAPVVATTRRSSGTYGAMSQSTIAQANFPQTRTVGGVLVTYSTSTQHSRMFVVPKCVHACFALVPFVITTVGSLTAIAAGEAFIALAEKEGFTDKQLMSWIEFGFPGVGLANHAVLAPPHVGAIKEGEAYEKCNQRDVEWHFVTKASQQ